MRLSDGTVSRLGAIQWHVDPGETIDIPPGAELMAERQAAYIYYNPHINVSYYIAGNELVGWDVIQYPYPLCEKCEARREAFLENGI